MDQERFDEITKALAANTTRRTLLRRLGAALGGALAWGTIDSSAAPPSGKPSKCYGGGSHCTNGKQCCSGICSNRQCTPEIPTVCAPGSTRSCYSGPADTLGKGVCKAGLETCLPDGSGYSLCAGEVGPTPEVCDGLDNDCDGVVDNDNPGGGASCNTGLPGICATGTLTCAGGTLICEQNVEAVTEICGNGLDDDCDGAVDEGCEEQCDPGYEWDGTTCADIDECANETHACDPVALCTNTEGSYTCACPEGYIGNGFLCREL